jgi:hypothetical protein
MENNGPQKDTAAWIFQVWASFLVAVTLLAIGIYYLPVDGWIRGYLAMGMLFSIGSSFSLAKTIRDNHEAGKLINRVAEAKTEKYLTQFEMK